MKKLQQEFFTLGVTKPTLQDIQIYLNHLGTRLMQVPDIIKKIEDHFKNIKNVKLDRLGRKVLSFEGFEMKKFKEYVKITEARDAYIWDTKPQTLKDAEDPEVQISGWGRMLLSQYRAQFVRASQDFLSWAKGGDYEWIEKKMSSYHGLLEGIQEIEKQMKKPAWKKKITMLKRAGK